MSTDATLRGMPEFRARRSTPPTVLFGFAEQLDARRAPALPRGVPQLATRTGVGAAGRPATAARFPARNGLDPQRAKILIQAERLLGVPYVWGGDQPGGMDCSAYLSRTWRVPRQTTDTLHAVADPIDRDELEAGDALNLQTWKDPSGHGHVRLFDRWADAARTRMWVYEETAETGRSVHRVIDWDDRYQPMRRRGLD
jgi:cell wall-associated NlpC family hydrolase